MNEQEFLDFFNALDEQILKLVIKDSYQKGQEHYNKLILDGWSHDEAMYDLIMKTSYRAMKYAVMVALYFHYVEPERPKTKEELKKLLTVIK